MGQPTMEKPTKEEMIDLTPEPAKAEDAKPTLKDAEAADLSPKEIEMAKKAGVIDEKAPEKPVDPPAEDPEQTAAEQQGKKPDEKSKQKFEPKPWEKDIPDEEKTALEQFTPNEKALYWKQKREKYRRQQSESERDQLKVQAAYYRGQAELASKALEEAKRKPATPAADPDADLDPLGDANDPAANDKNKPLTQGDLDRIEKEKADRAAEEAKKQDDRKRQIFQKLDEQENEFKQDHEDFDEKVDLSKQILDIARDDSKLSELFPDRIQRRAVKSMADEMLFKLVHPDQVKPGEPTAAELAYEIGKLHPKASDPGDADLEDLKAEKKRNEGSDPLEKRLDRHGRPSSASLSGGGSNGNKTIKDLTLKDLAEMPGPKFAALKKKYPTEIDRILRENNAD